MNEYSGKEVRGEFPDRFFET